MSDKEKKMKPTKTKIVRPTKVAKEKPKQPIKVCVATPMYGGLCTGFYMQSMMQLQQAMNARGWVMMTMFMFNESLIQRARNGLAQAFLKSDATHLLFIDADIRFNANEILAMVDADVDVIAGIYPKKEIAWGTVSQAVKAGVPDDKLKHFTGSFVVNLLNGKTAVTVPGNKPFEVDNAGTGCMLIKRRVLKKLSLSVPSYTNDVTDTAGTLGPEKIYEFFGVSIDSESNRLLSEDYDFCQKWRRIKGKIYAAPWVRLAHAGTYLFEGQLLPEPS